MTNQEIDIIRSLDSFAKLYSKPLCSKIELALCDYSMIYAAKCELKLHTVQTIVSMWLRLFPDGNDSTLDLEAEKYVSLGGKTAQIYEIGYQIYAKVITFNLIQYSGQSLYNFLNESYSIYLYELII